MTPTVTMVSKGRFALLNLHSKPMYCSVDRGIGCREPVTLHDEVHQHDPCKLSVDSGGEGVHYPSSHPFSTEGLLALRFFSAADTWLEKPIVIRTANSKWRMGLSFF